MTTFAVARQNDREALRYRAAADRYYGLVGVARCIELAIVATSVALGLIASANQTLEFDLAFWGIVLAVIDCPIIYYSVVANRHAAAQLSECFDRYLFGANALRRTPCSATADAILASAERRLSNRSVVERLSDWYDTRLGGLPTSVAHLAALRVNAFWDASLRGPYVAIMISIAAVVVIVASYLFSRNGFTLERLITNVLLPLAPAALWFARELVDQWDARCRKLEFQRNIEKLWDGASNIAAEDLKADVGYFQGVLFSYRRSDVSVPWWLYKITRNRMHQDVATLMESLLTGARSLERRHGNVAPSYSGGGEL